MKILIIEDEARIARRILRMTQSYFGKNIELLSHRDSLEEGQQFLRENPIDLLLLDLNLNGEDGFEVLKEMVSAPFHTIIISAYKQKAITAFEYGVLDFVPKPFNEKRLIQAFERITNKTTDQSKGVRFLTVQKKGVLRLIEVNDIRYIKGAGIYTELQLKDGQQFIHNKSLEKLSQLLPNHFQRIHKSYIVEMNTAKEIIVQSGSKYSLVLENGEVLPIGRTRYAALKAEWFG